MVQVPYFFISIHYNILKCGIIRVEKREYMKNDLKEVLLMGLGVMATVAEKGEEWADQLSKKGEEYLQKGKIANEELKHKIVAKMEEQPSVETIVESVEKLTEAEKEELLKKLSKKDGKNEKNKEK